jgi:hypothetical protein
MFNPGDLICTVYWTKTESINRNYDASDAADEYQSWVGPLTLGTIISVPGGDQSILILFTKLCLVTNTSMNSVVHIDETSKIKYAIKLYSYS